MSFKITFIGAGSLGFTRQLLTDILSVKELRTAQIAFTDINAENLELVRKLCQRDLEENNISTVIQATTDRREALKNAKYVINCVRIGGLEAFATDVEIPLKYGVDQCVGDTLCVGGIMYGQRVIAAMLDFCKDMREVCEPNVLHLNYSNPNAMATWACNQFGNVKTIGLCHGVIHGQEQIAEVLGLTYDEIDVVCAGINHQTWYLSVKHKGTELKDKLLDGFLQHERFSIEEKVRIDMLKRFGYYSTESNGHLSEYVAWYRKRPEEIHEWIDLSKWINGETAGYLRVCKEGRDWFVNDYDYYLTAPAKNYDSSQRGKEHGAFIIESLETGRLYRGHFNVVNTTCITNLPNNCIVEVPCYVDGNGISVPQIGDLPLGCAAVCSQSIWVQHLAVEAAVTGDVQLLKQAVLMDPLTGAVCNTPEIWQMVDEMLIAQKAWLPQYAKYIDHLEEVGYIDPSVKTKDYKGAARMHTKTYAEMKLEEQYNRKVATAAAKENVEK
jgi:alpha-galactosidase